MIFPGVAKALNTLLLNSNMRGEKMEGKEKNPIIAKVQVTDEEGNPCGKPVKIYDRAIISAANEKISQIKSGESKGAFGAFLIEVIFPERRKTTYLQGAYTRSTDVIEVTVKKDGVKYAYIGDPFAPRIRKSGEREYRPMWPDRGVEEVIVEGVLKRGEYVEFGMPFTYGIHGKEISRRGIKPKVVPVVKGGAIIRIEAIESDEESATQTYQGLLRRASQDVQKPLRWLLERLYQR